MNTLVARGSIPALNKSDMDAFKIPIPPLEVQREIVKVLDTFTELEAELEARQQQYEYYRDRLLTFKELPSPGGVPEERGGLFSSPREGTARP